LICREVCEFLPSAVNISTCLVSLNVYDLGSGPSSPWALRLLRNKENTAECLTTEHYESNCRVQKEDGKEMEWGDERWRGNI
jgi:hypothetical protein